MPRTTHSASTAERSPTDRRESPNVDEIAVLGSASIEARVLCAAATAAGLRIRLIGFESPAAEAAMAALGPGSVRLPLVIVGGRYALERPDFGGVLECLELLRDAHRECRPDAPVRCGCCHSLAVRGSLSNSERGEIADVVVWLCSDKSSFVTGATVPVDGGWTAH